MPYILLKDLQIQIGVGFIFSCHKIISVNYEFLH
ncbi:hypothetical protein X975_25220, partial [Stegodyphus mimosarum]